MPFSVSKHDFSFQGVGAASSAKLTFMVGGAEEEFTAAKELLSCMGANVVYCGQVGTGQVWHMFDIFFWDSHDAFVIHIKYFLLFFIFFFFWDNILSNKISH